MNSLQHFAVSEASIAFALKEGRNCNSAPCLSKRQPLGTLPGLYCAQMLSVNFIFVFYVCRCVHYMYCIVGVASKCIFPNQSSAVWLFLKSLVGCQDKEVHHLLFLFVIHSVSWWFEAGAQTNKQKPFKKV